MTTSVISQSVRPFLRAGLALACLTLAFSQLLLAAEESRSFDVPAGDAVLSLQRFSAQSGEQLLYSVDAVSGVRTAPVKGTFTSQAALDRMLAGTVLVAMRDQKTGAFNILRSDPNAGSRLPERRVASREPAARPAGRSVESEQIVTMSPFTVETDSDTGYGAVNANSVTGFNVELYRLPVSADVLSDTLMKDVGVSSVEEAILQLSAGAGFSTSDPGADAASNQPHDRNSTAYIQLRGLNAPTMKRDGFIRLGGAANLGVHGTNFSSNFDVERVEVINGPQSLLYGSGGAGGVMNTVSKQARLGRRPFGSLKLQIDHYGNDEYLFDYGAGSKRFALRLAAVYQNVGARRERVGGPMKGYYAQIAFRLLDNTIIRLSGEYTHYDRMMNTPLTLNAGGAAVDGRHNQRLHYLLATNQIQASAAGNSGAGPILNGKVNWDNVDSFGSWWRSELTETTFALLTAETRWNSWLSTQFAAGYNAYEQDNVTNSMTLHAPTSNANPFDTWAIGMSGGTPGLDVWRPVYTHAFRFSGLATNTLFNGRVRSQTILGADYHRSTDYRINHAYYRSDAEGNAIVNPNQTANQGRTPLPSPLFWPVADGEPIREVFWAPRTRVVMYNDQYYVRAQVNQIDRSLISPENPLGLMTLGSGGSYQKTKLLEKGVFGTNYAQWFDGRFDTLIGFRYNSALNRTQYGGRGVGDKTTLLSLSEEINFNVALTYRLRPWLRLYVGASDSYNPPLNQGTDPIGDELKTSHGIGQEAGLKFQSSSGKISGTIAVYHVDAKNESSRIQAALLSAINPSGLNGIFGSPSAWVTVQRKSVGAQATITASPTPRWRSRLSAAWTDGSLATSTRYEQRYNDQFHANAEGQVTYADGTVVYVRPTFTASQPVATPDTPGAIPLTIAMMSTPGNVYYANPDPISGRIAPTTNAARVLNVVDPVHGPILTGQVGLPIERLQIMGVNPPGIIETSRSGELTTGYPEFSLTLTNMYTFSGDTWLRGFRIGQNAVFGWRNRQYYYFPNGVSVDAERRINFLPARFRFDLIVGYEKRFRRFGWSAQLNVRNLFNRYDVVILPNPVSGFNGVMDATFSEQPRQYILSSTLSF